MALARYVGPRIVREAFAPARSDTCLTCTDDEERCPAQEIFAGAMVMGVELAEVFAQIAPEAPLAFCRTCTGIVMTAATLFDGTVEFGGGCPCLDAIKEFGAQGSQQPVKLACLGMAFGFILEAPPLCDACLNVRRLLNELRT